MTNDEILAPTQPPRGPRWANDKAWIMQALPKGCEAIGVRAVTWSVLGENEALCQFGGPWHAESAEAAPRL